MKTTFLASVAALLLASTAISRADTIDPLHLSCSTCSIDNGTFTPTNTNSPTHIDVDSSPPGASGTLLLKVLVPTNEIGSITNVSVTGASTGVASLFSSTPFTTGSLEGDYLKFGTGGGGSPPNMFQTFASTSLSVDPGLTGFDVFLFNAGQFTLTGDFATTTAIFNVNTSLPKGTWILADIASTTGCAAGQAFCNDITTAASSALFVNTAAAAVPGPVVGAGIPGLIAACLTMLGLNRNRKRRKQLLLTAA
jgi:hypothetical protein